MKAVIRIITIRNRKKWNTPREQEKPASKGRQEKTVYKKVETRKLKFSYNEQREYDTIEDDIGKLREKT